MILNPLVITLTRILIDIPFFERPILPINRAIVGATVEASETMEIANVATDELDKLLMDAKKARPRPKRKAARS